MRIKTYNRRKSKKEEMRRLFTIHISPLLKHCFTLKSSFKGIFPEIETGELTEEEEDYFNFYKDYLHFANEIEKA